MFDHLEKGTVADLDFILQEEARSEHRFIHRWHEPEHRRALTDPACHYVVGRNKADGAIGYGILFKQNDSAVELRRIVVSQPGKGIGSAFLKAVLTYCTGALQAQRVWLDVYEDNSRARHVYEKLGFRETPKRLKGDDSATRIVMEWRGP